MTMSVVVLLVVLFLSGLLTDLPKAVLGPIVFLVGFDLIDVPGLRGIWHARRSEFVIAALTGIVVFAVGVQQGIVLAIVLSILEMVRRQYRPKELVVGVNHDGTPTYTPAAPGVQSLPGLLMFRYDADLFYANANQFSDDVQQLIESAPEPIRWLVLDSSSIPDIDYSAAIALKGLIDFVHARGAVFALAGLDPDLRADLHKQGVLPMLHADHIFDSVPAAVAAFHEEAVTSKEQ
jgi:sulfate permease, SulP family